MMNNNTSTKGGGVAYENNMIYIDLVLMSLISLTAMVGNILVFLCYIRFRSLRCVTNVFILSLSASDLMVAFLSIPYTTAVYLFNIHVQLSDDSLHDLIYLTCDMVPSILSIYSLTLVAMDRAFAITKPFKHQKLVTRKLAWICVFFTGVFVCILVMPNFLIEKRAFTLYIMLASFILPIVIMVTCYSIMGYVAKSHASKLNELEKTANRFREEKKSDVTTHDVTTQFNEDSNVPLVVYNEDQRKESKNRIASKWCKESLKNITSGGPIKNRSRSLLNGVRLLRREFKAALTLSLILSCFVLSWTPFISLNFVHYSCGDDIACKNSISYDLVKYFKMLHYSNSALNPILYVMLNQRWRMAFKKILCFKRQRTFSSETIQSEIFGW